MGFRGEEQRDDMARRDIEDSLDRGTPIIPEIRRSEPDWYVDLKEDMENLKHYLKAETFDPKKKDWVCYGEPLMNEFGVGIFIGYLQTTALSKNLIMSNFPNMNMANAAANDICQSINTYLIGHRDKFDLEMKDVPFLNTIVRNMVRATVLRAFLAGDRGRVTSTYRRSETNEIPQQQPGFIQRLWGGGD